MAVVFLHAYANPAHEQRMADILAARLPNVRVSLSSVVAPKYREYERTSTVVVNAYLQPVMQNYLENLDRKAQARIFVMQSSGGITALSSAAREPVLTVLSGPAGGVAARMPSQANGYCLS